MRVRRLLPPAILTASILAPRAALAAPITPLGAEFRVNTYTTDDQDDPAIVSVGGVFRVMWHSKSQDDGFYGIYGQGLRADGTRVGAEMRVNQDVSGLQSFPSAAALSGSTFVVVGHSNVGSVVGQRFQASGSDIVALGAEFDVQSDLSGLQFFPAVGVSASGGFVVVWQSTMRDGSNYAVMGRRFAPTGAPLGDEFRINTYQLGNQERASVAVQPDGEFLVVWSNAAFGLFTDDTIMGQRYDVSGNPLSGEFRVNNTTNAFEDLPTAVVSPAGDFLVVWDSSNGIRAKRYSKAGAEIGTEFRINSTTTDAAGDPAIAFDTAGRFLVVWRSSFDFTLLGDLRARLFGPDAAPLGAELRVNTTTVNDQGRPAAISTSSGNFLVVWSSIQDGSGLGIYAQRLGTGLNGDVNGDGAVNVSDILYLINFLFAGGSPPIGPANVNGDGAVNVSDILYLINYLFAGGPAPV